MVMGTPRNSLILVPRIEVPGMGSPRCMALFQRVMFNIALVMMLILPSLTAVQANYCADYSVSSVMFPPYVPTPPYDQGGRRDFDGYDAVDSDRNAAMVDEAHVRLDTATQSSNSIPPSPPIFRGEYTPYYIQVDDVILNDDDIFNDDMRAPSEDVSENLLDPISPSAPSIQAPSFSSSEHPNHPARAFMPPLQRAETDRRHEIHSRDYGAGHPECRGCDGVCGNGPCVHCVSSWSSWGITNLYPPSR